METKKPKKEIVKVAPKKPVIKAEAKDGMVAIIMVRGPRQAKRDIKDTILMLNLFKKNSCIVKQKTPVIKGMIQKIKDFATWGDIDDKTISLLEKIKGKQKVYHLNPPRKGFGRKGIKKPFKLGGALGDRKEKINDLIQRMQP